MSDACVFCRIVAGDIDDWPVYEDDNCLAILDIAQFTVGHTLVVPKLHRTDIWDLSEDEASTVMVAVHRVAALLKARLRPAGINMTQANGAAAWQDVFHYHVHLVPRYGDDGFTPPWRSTSPTRRQLAEVRERIVGGQ